MEKDFEKKYHDIEQTHFWFRSRRNFILDLLKGHDKNESVLDIGCSSGILMLDLIKQGFNPRKVYGIDISAEAIKNCKLNGLNNTLVLDAQDFDLNKKFDIIIASDCLEHLKNDEQALQVWKKHLSPGGKMYVFVPAFMFLWSHHDVVNMHQRRYTKKELVEKLRRQDFNILKEGYWNFFLFLPVLLSRILSKMLPGKTQQSTGDLNKFSIFNRMMYLILSMENKLSFIFSMPIGVSTYCIVRSEKQKNNS